MKYLLSKIQYAFEVIIQFVTRNFIVDDYYDKFRKRTWSSILTMTRTDLEWKRIQAQASMSSNFTYVWVSTLIIGLVALFLNVGLSLAVNVIELGDAVENNMIYTVYSDFYLSLMVVTLLASLVGLIVLYMKGISTGKAAVFGIAFTMTIYGAAYFNGKNHTILIDCFFLIFFAFAVTFLMAVICDVNRRQSVIRLYLIEKRLKELNNNWSRLEKRLTVK